MYQIRYKYNHGTWIEPRCSTWLKTKEEVLHRLDYIKSYNAIDIKIAKLIDVTKEFEIN